MEVCADTFVELICVCRGLPSSIFWLVGVILGDNTLTGDSTGGGGEVTTGLGGGVDTVAGETVVLTSWSGS